MKKLIWLIIITAVLAGCGTQRVQTEVVTRTLKDTMYLSRERFDSIFIDRWQTTDRNAETITIKERIKESRYRLIRDTVYHARADTIPIIKEVEVTKNTAYIPWIYKYLSLIGLLAMGYILIRIFNLYYSYFSYCKS